MGRYGIALNTIEFAAGSAGAANDILRQAGVGGMLTAQPAGRLGYEATGARDLVNQVRDFLAAHGAESYVTPA